MNDFNASRTVAVTLFGLPLFRPGFPVLNCVSDRAISSVFDRSLFVSGGIYPPACGYPAPHMLNICITYERPYEAKCERIDRAMRAHDGGARTYDHRFGLPFGFCFGFFRLRPLIGAFHAPYMPLRWGLFFVAPCFVQKVNVIKCRLYITIILYSNTTASIPICPVG